MGTGFNTLSVRMVFAEENTETLDYESFLGALFPEKEMKKHHLTNYSVRGISFPTLQWLELV